MLAPRVCSGGCTGIFRDASSRRTVAMLLTRTPAPTIRRPGTSCREPGRSRTSPSTKSRDVGNHTARHLHLAAARRCAEAFDQHALPRQVLGRQPHGDQGFGGTTSHNRTRPENTANRLSRACITPDRQSRIPIARAASVIRSMKWALRPGVRLANEMMLGVRPGLCIITSSSAIEEPAHGLHYARTRTGDGTPPIGTILMYKPMVRTCTIGRGGRRS